MRIFSVSLALALVALASAGPSYTITALNGRPSWINGLGTLTVPGPQADHVYTQSGGTLTDLGAPYPGRSNGGMAINDAGDLVGISTGTTSTSGEWSFRFHNGTFSPLNGLAGFTRTRVYGLNAGGVAVGWSDYAGSNGGILPVVWTGNTAASLDLLAGDTRGYALRINDAGTVLGTSANATGTRTVVWKNGVPQALEPEANDGNISGFDLNNQGQVLGRSDKGSFIWQNGVYTRLGQLSSIPTVQPFDLNDAGEAVGYSAIEGGNFGDPTTAAFLFRNGQMIDLNSLLTTTQRATYHLDSALLINEAGQIVVGATTGSWPNQGSAMLLLTPNPVPEPATLAALGLGAASLLRRRRRRAQ